MTTATLRIEQRAFAALGADLLGHRHCFAGLFGHIGRRPGFHDRVDGRGG
jgi:hypothetical protein